MFYLDTLQDPPLTESLGTCIECKKQHMNSMSQHVKILQTSCFATFGSSACRGNFSA